MSSLSAAELLFYLVLLFGLPLVVLAIVSTMRNRSVGWIFLGLLSWPGAIAGVALLLRMPPLPKDEEPATARSRTVEPAPAPREEAAPVDEAAGAREESTPAGATAARTRAVRKPARSTSGPVSKDERTAMLVFGLCALVIAATWFFGFAMRARLSSVDIGIVRDPGLPLVFTDHIDSLATSILLIATAGAGYLGCLWAVRRGFRYSLHAVIGAITLASVALIPMMPLTSPDAVHLASDVRALWLHGRYPTSEEGIPQRVAEETGDPVAAEVRDYASATSSYGPVSYIAGGLSLPFVGDGLRANLAGVKAVAGLFLVLTAFLAALAARQLGRDPAMVAALIGLNPLMLWEFPGNGHNDTIMAAFGVAAVLFIVREAWPQRALGAGLGAASVLAKFGLAPAAPLVAAYWFPRWRTIIAIAVLASGALLVIPLITEDLPGPIVRQVAPAGVITRGFWRETWDLAGNGETSQRVIMGAAYGLTIAIAAYLTWRHPLKQPRDLVVATGILLFFFIFLGYAGYRPWYQIWYLPFAMLAGVRWLTIASILFSFGAFAITLAANWQGDIINELDISDPIGKASVMTWLIVGGAALLFWWMDRERAARAAQIESARRRPPVTRRRPIRSR